MEEIKREMQVFGAGTLRDRASSGIQEVTFWSFKMRRLGGRAGTYYMTTLEDPNGHLWVQFHTTRGEAESIIRHNHHHYGSLTLPWAAFERAARGVLTGPSNQEVPMLVPGYGRRGRLVRLDGDVRYTTECHEQYTLEASELEALLS